MAVVACSGPGLGAASPVGPAEPVGRVVDARGDERDETDVRSRRRKAGSGRPARDDGRLRRRGRPPGRRRRAWRGRPSETSTYSGGAGARPLRPGPLRTGMSPRLATSIQRPSPGPSVAPAGAGSSGSRRVRRWCGCGGSADDVAVGSFGQVDVGPVEEALPLDAGPGGHFLPGAPGELLDQGVRAELACMDGDFATASHWQHVAGTPLLQGRSIVCLHTPMINGGCTHVRIGSHHREHGLPLE